MIAIGPTMVFLKNKRSKSEIWKKTDIEKHFELTELKDKKLFNKYLNFTLIPISRFTPPGSHGPDMVIEQKLTNFDDVLYFKLMGIDREVSPDFVRYIDCGFVALKRNSFRNFKL